VACRIDETVLSVKLGRLGAQGSDGRFFPKDNASVYEESVPPAVEEHVNNVCGFNKNAVMPILGEQNALTRHAADRRFIANHRDVLGG
jgi:hypothetical protein